MKKKITKALSVMLAVVLTLTAAPLSGFVGLQLPDWLDFSIGTKAAETSGTCGDNLTWNYDEETCTLTISGSGEMFNFDIYDYYDDYLPQPWKSFQDQITSIVINEGVTSIGSHAFQSLYNIVEVSLPDSLISIGYEAFLFGGTLECLTIPKNVSRISSGNNVHGFDVVSENPYFSSEDGVLFNKDKTELVFYYDRSTIRSYVIPDSVTTIGEDAFYDTYYLGSITIPNSVTTIGEDAFYYCYNLISINIPDSVETIGDRAFTCCSNLVRVTIGKGVTDIGDSAFSYSEKLMNIVVSENNDCYRSIDGILYNKDKTELIKYPEGKKEEDFVVPDSVAYIDDNALNNCNYLVSLKIPDSVKTIGLTAIYSCKKLEVINIGKGLSLIGNQWQTWDYFSNCPSLMQIYVSKENKNYCSVDGVLFSKDKNILYCYPSGRTGGYVVPEGTTTIGEGAFGGTHLTNIYVSETVSKINDFAFMPASSNLKAIKIYNSMCQFDESWFMCEDTDVGNLQHVTLYGHIGSNLHWFAKEHNLKFADISNPSVPITVQTSTLTLNYSSDKNNIQFGDVLNVGADYKRGNSLGMLYDGDIRWEVGNQDVLRIESYSTNATVMYFKAIGLGTSTIELYLDGELVISDTVNVDLSQKTLLEDYPEYVYNSSSFSTLSSARGVCSDILSGCNGVHKGLSAFFHSVENGLGVGVIAKETLAELGIGQSQAEEAADKAAECILLEMMNEEDILGNASKKTKDIYENVEMLYNSVLVDDSDMYLESLADVMDLPLDDVKSFKNSADNFKSKSNLSFDVIDITTSAMLISRFEAEVIKEMRDSTSYGSCLYLALDRLYEKRIDLVGYGASRFLTEQSVNVLTNLTEEIFKLAGGPVYNVLNIVGKFVAMGYDGLGGLDADEYMVAQNACGFAGYLLNYTIKTRATVENFDRLYNYYVAAVKSALKCAEVISRSSKLTDKAEDLYAQITAECQYDNFLDSVRNDIDNKCMVSKETLSNEKALACYPQNYSVKAMNFNSNSQTEEIMTTSSLDIVDYENVISVPGYIDDSEIVGIADYGFEGIMGCQGFKLPQTIETIGNYSFSNCTDVIFVHLNEGLTKIGECSFSNCTSLKTINITSSVQTIGNSAFANCSALGTISFSENLSSLGNKAFENCTALKEVYFENANTVIPTDAFAGCSDVTIYGYAGSTAQELATELGFSFVDLGKFVKKLEILSPATQQSVLAGEAITTAGLIIKAIYADGSTEIVSSGWSTVCDVFSVGEQRVYVCYEDAVVSYPITVEDNPIKEINLSDDELTLFVTNSYQITAECNTKSLLDDLVWSSDNTNVAIVNDSGYVSTVGVGTARITVSSKDENVSSSCQINVVNNESLRATDGKVISSLFTPVKAGYYSFYATGSSEKITAVLYNTFGEMIAVNSGNNPNICSWLSDDEAYYIVFQTSNENTFTFNVCETPKAEAIKLNKEEYSDCKGTTYYLYANCFPTNTLREDLKWTTSDSNIVTVDEDGWIKLLKEGTATITATSENGLTDTCIVTVSDYPTIKPGKTNRINVTFEKPSSYFYFTPEADGKYTFYSSYNEQPTYGCIFDSDMNELTSDTYSGTGSNFKMEYYLNAGETYLLHSKFIEPSQEGRYCICIKMVKSIKSLEVISLPSQSEYVRGHIAEALDLTGLKLKVTWSDDSITYWTADDYWWYIGDEEVIPDTSNLEESGEIVISCGDSSVNIELTIIDNPVDHLEIVVGSSYSYIENYEGYIDENDSGSFFRYYTYYPYDAVVEIVYKDGTTKTTKIGESVGGYYVRWTDNQEQNPWVVGTDNKSTVSYLDHTVNLPITVKENPVENIEVVSGKIICYEGINGYVRHSYNEETEQYEEFFYYNFDVPNNTLIKINYTDGTTNTVSIEDNEYIFYYDSNQDENPWTLGEDNYVEISYLGKTAKITACVLENPVDYIKINNAPTREYIYGDALYGTYYDDCYYLYPTDLAGLSFTVYYKDGSSKTYTHNDIDSNSEIDGYKYELTYDSAISAIGNVTVTFNYMGKSADYDVLLKQSPIESISMSMEPSQSICYANFAPDFFGAEFTIKYKDGSEKIVSITDDNIECVDSSTHVIIVDGYPLYLCTYGYLCDNTAMYFDKYCNFDVFEYDDSYIIETFEVQNPSRTGEGMNVSITYCNGETDSFELEVIEFNEYDYGVNGRARTPNGIVDYHIQELSDDSGNITGYKISIFNKTITVPLENITCNHEYEVNTVNPTCTIEGKKTYVCKNCGNTYTEIIPAVGHNYNTTITHPTCTEDGYTTYNCSACGDSYVADETSALGHINGGVVEENYVAPTCTANGSKDNATYCTVCGIETSRVQESIPALGHSFENGACTVCGEVDPNYVPEEPVYNYTFSIQSPSTTTISKKNGIILHANIEGNAPDGSYVVWTASNNKFTTSTVDKDSLKIISNKNGYTTFTATLYDADGNVLASDSIEMRSKAGFFDVIASWFRKATVYES